VISSNFAIFHTCKTILWVGALHGCAGMLPGKEGGIQVLSNLGPSSQTVGSLLRIPWPANSKGDQKNLMKSEGV